MRYNWLIQAVGAQQYWQFQQRQQQQQQQGGQFTTTCTTLYPSMTSAMPQTVPQLIPSITSLPSPSVPSSMYVPHVGDREYNPACPFYSGLPNFLISRNYSSIFHLPLNASEEKSIDASCAASQFCSERPPGLYCYRPPADPCTQQANNCLPVAILSCPEAVLIGCAEGFACHQDPEPWPWDLPVSQRYAYMVAYNQSQAQGQLGTLKLSPFSPFPTFPFPILQPQLSKSQQQSQYQQSPFTNFQVNMTAPGSNATNATAPGQNMTPPQQGMQPEQQPMAVAHCYAVLPENEEALQKSIQAAMAPNNQQDMSQWCSYRMQLKASPFNLTYGSGCQTKTLAGFQIQKQQRTETKCPESISTVWWWSGMERGTPPPQAKTAISLASNTDPCVLLPPPSCAGPYPYAPTTTATIVYVSPTTVAETLPGITQTTTVSAPTATTTLTSTLPPTTIIETRTQPAVTVTQVNTVSMTITAATPVPAVTEAPAPAVTAAPAAKATLSPASGSAAVAPEAFPRAGEPFSIYTAKIGAIATVA